MIAKMIAPERKKNEKTKMIAKMIAPKMIAAGAKKNETEMIAEMIALPLQKFPSKMIVCPNFSHKNDRPQALRHTLRTVLQTRHTQGLQI